MDALVPDMADMQYRYPSRAEMEFWSASDFTKHTFETARARGIPPFALNLAHLERLAAAIPPEIQSPDLGRGYLCLNWNGVAYGQPGTGKSTSHRISRLSMPLEPDIMVEKPGSGEGLRDLFGASLNGHNIRDRYNALVIADEGAILAALTSQKSNTFLETIREAFGGETIGNSNSRAGDRSIRIPEGCYRLIFHINLQPAHARVLWSSTQLGDGTLQRFVFADADILYLLPPGQELIAPPPMDNPLAACGLILPGTDEFGMIHPVQAATNPAIVFPDLLERADYTDRQLRYRRDPLPPQFVKFIKAWDYAVKSGKKGPEYAHYAVLTVKIAYAFAVAHHRSVPTELDLALAQFTMEHSMQTAYRMRDDSAKNVTDQAVSRGRARGAEELAFQGVMAVTESRREELCEQQILRILENEPNGQLNKRELRRRLTARYRLEIFPKALDSLLEQNKVHTSTPGRANQIWIHLGPESND